MPRLRATGALGGALAASMVLGSVGSSDAAGRFTKKEESVPIAQTALTRPAAKPDRDKKQPDLRASDVFRGQGAKLQAVNESRIKVLLKLIANTSDSDAEMPDLLFRLAELYAEQTSYYNFRAHDLDEKIFTAKESGQTELFARLSAEKKDFEEREHKWLLDAVKKYMEVADGPKYQSYQKMDQVLFYLAYLLTQAKKEDGARVFFKRLIKDYPQSPFLPHAYLSFGDYFFENRDLANALSFYEKVLQYTDSPVQGYAMYKKAWVHYNLTDYKSALATFIDVINYASSPGKKEKKSDAQLVREAKKDLVRTYALVGTPDKAWPFFQKHGKDYAPAMLEQLAELYNAQGKFEPSNQIYHQLIELAVKKKAIEEQGRLCAWQTEILRNTLSLTGSRAVPETVRELQRLSAVYEQFQDRKDVPKAAVEECRDHTAGMLRELAMVWHKEAQSSHQTDSYVNAADLYKEYIRRFPTAKDSYEVQFFYAELLFQLGTMDNTTQASHYYCDAAPVYTQVAKLDPKGKRLKDAAYAAVISWKNCLGVADDGQEAATAVRNEIKREQDERQQLQPKPIADKYRKMLEAFDTYVQLVPDAPELPTIKYRRAFILYAHNHFDEAAPLFRDLVENHTGSELAVYSANLLLGCLSARLSLDKDKAAVHTAALEAQLDKFEKTPALLRAEGFERHLKEVRRDLLRLQIERVERSGDARTAGKLYLQYADRYPDDPKIAEIYHNAAVNFERANLIGLAIQAREKLISIKPDDPLAMRSIYRTGQSFAAIAAYEDAATRYETFAIHYPRAIAKPDKAEVRDHDHTSKSSAEESDSTRRVDAPSALRTAAFYRRGLGESERSIDDANLFIKNYGGQKEYYEQAAGVFFEMAQVYEQRRDNQKLKQHLAEYLHKWASKGGIDRQIVAEVKLGELLWQESCPAPGGGVQGACVQITRQHASAASAVAARTSRARGRGKQAAQQCGPATKSKIVVLQRRPALVKEAMAHFDRALALYKDGEAQKSVPTIEGSDRDGRIGVMTYYAAMALMTKGDQEYEDLLDMKVPGGLSFDPSRPREYAAAQKRFLSWITEKSEKLSHSQDLYRKVISWRSAHWSIAAAARIGQLYQDFANGLYTVEIPVAPPAPSNALSREEWTAKFSEAYCDAMATKAEPLDDKAVEGLAMCLNKSTELSWFNEWSKLCETELNQIKPVEYPLATEIRVQPGYSPSVTLDSAPAIVANRDK